VSLRNDEIAWIDVPDVDRMEPFLVSVVSPSDHWLYASSRGGLTAGRVHAEGALFPYVTDDLLHRAHEDAGGWTCLHVDRGGARTTWEPLRPRMAPHLRRSLHKSVAGDRLRYVEHHDALDLSIEVQWAFSEAFGLVRTVSLRNRGAAATIHLADGLNGLLPAGAPLGLVQTASCLVDAYGRAAWDEAGELAIFSLEALPSDRAEPAEALRANVAWCHGLDVEAVLLSRTQLDAFARGEPARAEARVTGRPRAFLVTSTLHLPEGGVHTWHIVADVDRTQAEVVALRGRDRATLHDAIHAEIDATTRSLDGILADVDGLQRTGDAVHDAHQRASALFNAMRGGVPVDEHRLRGSAFRAFVQARNAPCHARNRAWLDALAGETIDVRDLFARAQATGDADLQRLVLELLPLWFGRRHGDPSRPWNRFSIRVHDADGRRRVYWQGNWRDVFQNWEALLLAYPSFVESVIAVFVNASTLDGFNPYRITSDGVDWEQPEPENPWSNIGYWGDHQVSYLTRLLELSLAHAPGRLTALLDQELFSSADVPYRLRTHAELVADPRDAIVFDHDAQRAVDAREARVGSDGRRVHDERGVLHLNLAEKLLLPVLAKLSALVPGAGIWMNTQRPEWNDANNALAGNGVSVVTAAYLRRHLAVLRDLFAQLPDTIALTEATADWIDAVSAVLADDPRPWTPSGRRAVLDRLGTAADAYRGRTYGARSFPRTTRTREATLALLDRGLRWLDDALRCARRPDGLIDGYDLVRFTDDGAEVERLYPMLEGQVAALASGALSPVQAADLLDRMYAGPLYRSDVKTFLLYPERELPGFLDKNRVPEAQAAAIPSLAGLLAAGTPELMVRDADGALRFGADLRNAGDLAALLARLDVPEADRPAFLALWEATFHHHAFTGRSGTMHAYEGLGSVYWHMVGKLLLAVLEGWQQARREGADAATIDRLAALYHRVRDGLGFNRSPAAFGAIPSDPYSHTPAGRGAQQPGMTGLVKEELVARRGELGVRVVDGRITFEAPLLQPAEPLRQATTWTVPAGVRPARTVEVPAGGVAFLVCGVPVVRVPGAPARIEVTTASGTATFDGAALDVPLSQRIFARDPEIVALRVVGG
jgi:hypothetical protein